MKGKIATEFPHNPDFQEAMLALMTKDSAFAAKALEHIPLERLYSEAHQYLFGEIGRIIRSKGRQPTIVEIEDQLKSVEKYRRRMLKTFCTRVFERSVTAEDQFIREKITEYARVNSFIEIFQTAQTYYNSSKRDEAYQITLDGMKKLMAISFVDDEPIAVEDFERVRLEYLSRDHSRIPTGLDELDKVINGGLAKGELGAVLAAAKVGKSQMLTNIGYNAIKQNKTVMHAVLEGVTEQATMRYQSRFTGIEYSRLKKRDLSKAELARLSSRGKLLESKLFIEPMNMQWSYKPEDIEGRLDRFSQKNGKRPDLLIIDYGDLLKSSGNYQEFRHEQEAVYQKLKTLAMKQGIAIWTAMQSNRQREEDRHKNLTDSSVAESYAKARLVDLMISLNRTDAERESGVLRIHVALNRDGASGETIYAVTDYTRAVTYSEQRGWFRASELRAMKSK